MNVVYFYYIHMDEFWSNAPVLCRFKGCGYNSRATFNGAGTVAKIKKDAMLVSLQLNTTVVFGIPAM